MAGTQNSLVQAKELRCNSCESIFGVTSSDGLPEPITPGRRTCENCAPFETLHEKLEQAKSTWLAMEPRRSNFGGRIEALAKHREAHKELANFLLRLGQNEGPPNDNQTPVQESCQTDPAHQEEIAQRPPPPSAKRPRSPTSIPASDQSTLLDQPRLIERKRVKFDPATIIRRETEYRQADEYQRDTEAYVRGRNAAPEGDQYLDTSGHSLEYKVFHQLKWNNRLRQWVQAADEDEDG